MSKFDLVVFGATGFTGKRAIEELARGGKRYAGISWAVAGRSQKKLEELLQEVTKKTSEDLSAIKIIISDVKDYDSLKQMCAQARVIVNACGPYRLFGEPVVKAAIETKVHYVDVSGEPQFIETMQLKYDKEAREAGVYIISACGMDSIPNDLGVIFLEQNFDGTLNSVESYLSAELNPEYKWEAFKGGSINYTTWESLVHSLAHFGELGPLRKQLYPERIPTFEPKLKNRLKLVKREINKTLRLPIHKYNGWCVPFLGADNSIVYRTQRALYTRDMKRPVQFRAYLRFNSLLTVVVLALGAAVLMLLSKYETTRRWLLAYPRLFSLGTVARGPARRVNENGSVIVDALFELVGRGWSRDLDQGAEPINKTTVAKISMVDPGYGFTVLALIQSAITILNEQDKLPPQGGVLTTGVAFRKTNIIKNMQESDPNVKFEIIEVK